MRGPLLGFLSGKAVLAVIARGVSLAAALALSVAVARLLPVAAAGTFFICVAVATLVSTAARGGVDTLLLREISGRGIGRRELRRLVTGAGVLLSGAALATGVVASILLPGAHSARASGAVSVGVIVAATGTSVILGAILRASHRLTTGILVEMGLAQGVGAILLVTGAVDGDLVGALEAYAVGAVFACLVGGIDVGRHFVPSSSGEGSLSPRARALTLFTMMATTLMFFAIPWAPLIVLGARSTPEEAAYYSIALRVATLMAVIPSIQVTYLAPIMAGLAHRRDMVGLSQEAGRAARWAALPALVLFVPLVLWPDVVLQIFGENFTSHTPLVPASLGVFLPLFLGPVNVIMLYCGHEKVSSVLNLGLLVIMLAGVWAVAPGAGASGTSWVVASTTVVYAVVAATYLKWHDGIGTTVLSRPNPAGTPLHVTR